MKFWTLGALKEHYDQRFDDLRRDIDRVEEATERASEKAATALDPLREQFPTREAVDARFQSLESHVGTLESGQARVGGRFTGSNMVWVYILGAVAALSAVMNVVVAVAR